MRMAQTGADSLSDKTDASALSARQTGSAGMSFFRTY